MISFKPFLRKVMVCMICGALAGTFPVFAQDTLSLVTNSSDFVTPHGQAVKITSDQRQVIEKIHATGKSDFSEGLYAFYQGGTKRSSDQYVSLDTSAYHQLVFDVIALTPDNSGDFSAYMDWMINREAHEKNHASYEDFLSQYPLPVTNNQQLSIAEGSLLNPLDYPTSGLNIHIHNSSWQVKYAITPSNQWETVALDIRHIGQMHFHFGLNGAGAVLVANPRLIKDPTAPSEGPSPWAIEGVFGAQELHITTENTQSGFTDPITREAFAEVMVNLYNVVAGIPEDLEQVFFVDTDNPAVSIAAGLGLVNGVGNQRFAPDAPLTREQIATIFDRFLLELGIEMPVSDDTIHFIDEDLISDWAKPHVQNLFKMGILQGISERQIAPGLQATKEQALVLSVRLYEMIYH